MNREIMFRAFDKLTKQMMFIGYHMVGEVTCFGGMEIFFKENPVEGADIWERWNNVVEMEWTGLKDITGTDIYEGDVLSMVIGKRRKRTEWTYRVFWDTDTASFMVSAINSDKPFSTHINTLMHPDRVLGNVWENPELIKTG
jgi:uncharacterized phage protein (TIGR01671 family)